MDKRLEENLRVKNEIAKAYIHLLKSKDHDEIPVTLIVSKANVSRMAYYRNFKSRVDIIRYYLDVLIWANLEERLSSIYTFYSLEYGIAFLETMKKHRDFIMLLYNRGLSNVILDSFDEKNEELAGDMPANSITRYKLYLASGASFNAMMHWIKNGCKESVQELAQYMYEFIIRNQ